MVKLDSGGGRVCFGCRIFRSTFGEILTEKFVYVIKKCAYRAYQCLRLDYVLILSMDMLARLWMLLTAGIRPSPGRWCHCVKCIVFSLLHSLQ